MVTDDHDGEGVSAPSSVGGSSLTPPSTPGGGALETAGGNSSSDLVTPTASTSSFQPGSSLPGMASGSATTSGGLAGVQNGSNNPDTKPAFRRH